jgi:hypothetical protein
MAYSGYRGTPAPARLLATVIKGWNDGKSSGVCNRHPTPLRLVLRGGRAERAGLAITTPG